MRGWRSTAESDDGEPDPEVQDRFVRVVGLPRIDDDESVAPPVVEPPSVRAREALSAALDPRRRGVRALALVAAVVVVIAASVAWWSRPRIEPVPGMTQPAGAPATEASAVIVVAVAGRVVRPGLVRLPAGSRVADAIAAAGGVLPGTDLSYVNLARKLIDGELIVIGVTPPPNQGGTGGAPGTPEGPVNLNTATLAQLDALPGVGPVLAARIIDYRIKHGGFRSVTELRQVAGVGDAKFEQLKDLVTV
jgi:competence protein ComEA